jgi:ribonucleoside-diphosphate reductase alpha chain/ribonucleoside-diphosphate reductase subunit M1
MQSSDLKIISKDTINYKKIEDNSLNTKMIDNTQIFNTTMSKNRKSSVKDSVKDSVIVSQSDGGKSTKTSKTTDNIITVVNPSINGDISESVKLDKTEQLDLLDQRFSQLKKIITELETVNESNKISEVKNLVQSLESALIKKYDDESNKINNKIAEMTYHADNSDVDTVGLLEQNLTEKIEQIDSADILNRIPLNRKVVERKKDKKNALNNESFLKSYNKITESHNIQVKITQTFVRTFLKEIVNDIKNHDKEKIPKTINIDLIVKNITDSLPKTMDQDGFYMYVAEYLVAKSSYHYYYDMMAARIAVKRLHNITSPDFLETARMLQENLDKNNDKSSILSDEIYDIIVRHHARLQEAINYDRDFLFDYFGIKTLERSYLYKLHFTKFKIIERPQHMIMRVALGIHFEDIDSVIETYDLISQKFFTHATPTLFNSGTIRPQMSSCFLQSIDDSIESIFDAIKDIAFTSKWSGGIGVHLSALRCRGSLIRGTNGMASGIIPLCIVLNKLAKYINQGGKRNGSIACYLETHHPDIFDFCDLRKETGNDDNRARDLFLALWVSTLFMNRVRNDEMWSLMCPDECPGLNQVYGDEYNKLYLKYESEGRFVRQVRAQDLWKHILESQSETGFPYILYKDNANEKSNQKNLGTIRSSNLCAEIIQYSDENETAVCFTADTMIITKEGQKQIIDCDGAEVLSYFDNDVDLNHSEHYEKAQLIYNGKKQVYELSVYGQKPLKVTEDHPILVKENNINVWKKVSDIDISNGSYSKNQIWVPNINPIEGFDIKERNSENKWLCKWSELPINEFIEQLKTGKAYELSGLLSGMFSIKGSSNIDDASILSIDIYIDNDTLLYNVQSALLQFGIKSHINFNCSGLYIYGPLNHQRFIKYIGFGLDPEQEAFCNKYMITNSNFINNHEFVISITKLGIEDVYDLVLPKSHNFIANGIVVHNCNLASICLPMYIDQDSKGTKTFNHEKLIKVCRVIVRNLDKIIDRNYYPTEKTRISNERHRPMGIGVQGLGDVYNLMGYPFSSDEAFDLNKRIFETIYYACVDESKELAKRFGPYSTFIGSPASDGLLQYHMWHETDEDRIMPYDWKKLVEEVKTHGLRNSLLTALMPTASTSQIMGNSECIEPYMSNIFKRSTLAGEFIVVNKNLMKDLLALELWDDDMRKRLIIENGSVQNIQSIPEKIRHIYMTAFEIPQMYLVRQSADRGKMVDQAQSFNLFLAEPDFDILTSALFDGHDLGNKTGMYYYRSLPAVNPINFGIDVDDIKRLTGRDASVDMISGSYNFDKKSTNVDSNDKMDTDDKKKSKSKSKPKAKSALRIPQSLIPLQNNKTSDQPKWRPGMKSEDCISCGS